MRAARYDTRRLWVILSLIAGAVTGALLVFLQYLWDAIQIHGLQYTLNYGWLTSIYVFIGALMVWAMGLTILGLPLWWLFHKFQLRHWLMAAAVGAAMTFFVGFAINTRFFELIPPPANSTYNASDSGGPTVIDNWRTPHGWWVAFQDALMLSAGGVLVALVIWRVAYRRVDGVPSQ